MRGKRLMSFIETKILTYSGLSTDIKPTSGAGDDVLNGSRFREVDTEKIYIYNLSDDDWYLINQRSIIYDPINDRQVELEPNGSVPVTIQDQTTPPFIIYASQVTNETTLAIAAAPDDTDITVTDSTGIIVGDYLGIFNTATDAFYVGTVIGIALNVLSMDTPIDMDFEIGDTVGTGITNMNVDGSTTTQVFTLRGADPGLSVTLDITRIMILCVTDTATELTDFGDISGGLLKGLVMRRADGMINNIFNFKTNIEMKGAMFDWDALEASNPGQGVFGFSGRLTFAGQNKMGVVIRIGPGESLELLVQDNLESLLRLNVIFEGSVAIV